MLLIGSDLGHRLESKRADLAAVLVHEAGIVFQLLRGFHDVVCLVSFAAQGFVVALAASVGGRGSLQLSCDTSEGLNVMKSFPFTKSEVGPKLSTLIFY